MRRASGRRAKTPTEKEGSALFDVREPVTSILAALGLETEGVTQLHERDLRRSMRTVAALHDLLGGDAFGSVDQVQNDASLRHAARLRTHYGMKKLDGRIGLRR